MKSVDRAPTSSSSSTTERRWSDVSLSHAARGRIFEHDLHRGGPARLSCPRSDDNGRAVPRRGGPSHLAFMRLRWCWPMLVFLGSEASSPAKRSYPDRGVDVREYRVDRSCPQAAIGCLYWPTSGHAPPSEHHFLFLDQLGLIAGIPPCDRLHVTRLRLLLVRPPLSPGRAVRQQRPDNSFDVAKAEADLRSCTPPQIFVKRIIFAHGLKIPWTGGQASPPLDRTSMAPGILVLSIGHGRILRKQSCRLDISTSELFVAWGLADASLGAGGSSGSAGGMWRSRPLATFRYSLKCGGVRRSRHRQAESRGFPLAVMRHVPLPSHGDRPRSLRHFLGPAHGLTPSTRKGSAYASRAAATPASAR